MAGRGSERRRAGGLEQDVLVVLWAAASSLTPAEVQAALTRDLAYTTVTTILSRLHAKGLLERTPRGRAFSYRPLVSGADLTAQRLAKVLADARTPERPVALTRFVASLSARDRLALEAALRDGEG